MLAISGVSTEGRIQTSEYNCWRWGSWAKSTCSC